MKYKEIYDELETVLWGSEIAKTKQEDEEGIGFGYLLNIHDPFHNYKGKYDEVTHERVLKIFKKFADKLYLETKDEYAIKLLLQACVFTSECYINLDMDEILGTYKDPAYMFDGYDTSKAIEPKPEDRYRLIERYNVGEENEEEKITNYRFYEEAKNNFDDITNNIKEFNLKYIGLKEDDFVLEDNKFKVGKTEIIIEKR